MTPNEKSEKTLSGKSDILEPYRRQIDAIDKEIVEALARRYGIVREVGHVKAREGLPVVVPARIDEVLENVARMATEKKLDPDFVRGIFAQLIEHSCEIEEEIMRAPKAAE